MDIHKNAKLTPQSRAAIVRRVLDQGQPPAAVAVAVGVCARTVRKWVVRYQAEGADGGVVARIVTGPHDANQQDPYLPMRYDAGRPRAVIRFRMAQPRCGRRAAGTPPKSRR